MSTVIDNPTIPESSTPNSQGGFDIVGASDQENQLVGSDNPDSIATGTANDVIDGGAGDDVLSGGGGSDMFVLGGGRGTDTITDFEAGGDLLRITGDLTPDQLTIIDDGEGNTVVKVVETGEVIAILEGVDPASIDSSMFTPDAKEIAIGGTANDRFVAGRNGFDGNREILETGSGDDFIDLSESTVGRNRIYTGRGNDEIIISEHDRIFAGEGNDTLDASLGRGNNRIDGDVGNDEFYVGSNDTLSGGEGDDLFLINLNGGSGGNFIAGGDGADRYEFFALEGIPEEVNEISDFTVGEDEIAIRGASSNADVDYDAATGMVSINGQAIFELDRNLDVTIRESDNGNFELF